MLAVRLTSPSAVEYTQESIRQVSILIVLLHSKEAHVVGHPRRYPIIFISQEELPCISRILLGLFASISSRSIYVF
jgi:hypothetical protein